MALPLAWVFSTSAQKQISQASLLGHLRSIALNAIVAEAITAILSAI